MSETSNPIHDPSNGLSDKVFWRTLAASFVCILMGVADPLLNALIHKIELQNLGWFSRLVLNVTGPLDIAQRLRADDFWAFSLFAGFVSFILAFGLGAITFGVAWLFDDTDRTEG